MVDVSVSAFVIGVVNFHRVYIHGPVNCLFGLDLPFKLYPIHHHVTSTSIAPKSLPQHKNYLDQVRIRVYYNCPPTCAADIDEA